MWSYLVCCSLALQSSLTSLHASTFPQNAVYYLILQCQVLFHHRTLELIIQFDRKLLFSLSPVGHKSDVCASQFNGYQFVTLHCDICVFGGTRQCFKIWPKSPWHSFLWPTLSVTLITKRSQDKQKNESRCALLWCHICFKFFFPSCQSHRWPLHNSPPSQQHLAAGCCRLSQTACVSEIVLSVTDAARLFT